MFGIMAQSQVFAAHATLSLADAFHEYRYPVILVSGTQVITRQSLPVIVPRHSADPHDQGMAKSASPVLVP
jgi:predicted ATP-grasp superfamily ATP-dependent carboligase